ncbi:plasmid pRiA4b ORF-3 family protein (plasmid) [Deinococcus taeanensis]|uniref:plasmid pRiA4b ORF-3 family protein n=1 Tax=Deinococcus taeanensis TaxID=2737050 RepID=UPI001CDB4968|nr:plasmid pRiA4b ORF-3 family protein [Deinococcus taeanensis]UBV44084.1 plasmid pRiA4b ORF-3 family protein [Deinococcus taeanensis]
MTTSRQPSRGMCRACGYVGTKASMTKHQAGCALRQAADGPTHDVWRLRVSGADLPAYWLDVEMLPGATLDDLDRFLRDIWLECCGHLSSFTIGPQFGHDWEAGPASRRTRQPPLAGLGLQPGDRFGYTYDFGSSTTLTVQVQAYESVSGNAADKVKVLARNLPPVLTCTRCGKPARWVHTGEADAATGGPLLYCGVHGRRTRDEQLPVVNSPRMGVCGYEGRSDEHGPPASPGLTGKPDPAHATRPTRGPGQDVTRLETLSLLDEDLDQEVLAYVQTLPLQANTVWMVAVQELPDVLPTAEGLSAVVLVVDAASGQIMTSEVTGEITAQVVQEIVLGTMLAPEAAGLEPQRPGQIFTLDAALAFSLHTALAALGIRVERRDDPEFKALLARLSAEVSAEMRALVDSQRPQAFLQDVPDQDVRDLVETFARFMKAKPWQTFAPDKPLRASWTNPDGTGSQLYATVLGDLGEVHGLALYPDWLTYNKHLLNSFNPELVLLATGGLESLTLSRRDEVHPDDWERLRAAGLPARAKAGPALARVGQTGTERPTCALRPLTAVLNILSARAERSSRAVTSLNADLGGIRVKYPADPRDELSAQDRRGSIELQVRSSVGPFTDDGVAVLTGPPEMLVRTALAQARRLLEQPAAPGRHVYLPSHLESAAQVLEDGGIFGDLHVRVWESRPSSPALTLAHLTALGPLVDGGLATIEVRTRPAEVDGLTVALRPVDPEEGQA